MNPLVSVIIPHKNDSDRLQLCIDALLKQTYPGELFEIIIVDNGSDIHHLKTISNFPDLGNLFVESEPCNGSYAARNKGISKARGKYIAFTDSDCIPDNDWLANGVKKISKSENLGFLSGRIKMFFNDEKNPNVFELYDSFYYLKQDIYLKLNFGATANLFSTREVINNVGKFNDNLFSGGDVEWGRRVMRKGYKSQYSTNLVVNHPARKTLSEIITQQKRLCRGDYDLDNIYGLSKFKLIRKNLFYLLPPILTIYKMLRSEKLQEVKDINMKLKLIALRIFIRYFKVYENIKLTVGVKSDN